MPRTSDTDLRHARSVLLVGPPGGGKTTQYHTLPPGGFLYIFDPNALESLRGSDIEFEQFSADLLDLNVKPLAKKRDADVVMKLNEPKAYNNWEEHFEKYYKSGQLKSHAWVGNDSWSTFSDMVMDRVQYLNNRMGKHPEQADWTAQMVVIHNIARVHAALDIPFIATCHEEPERRMVGGQQVATGRQQLYLTGRLKIRIPLLFSNIFFCEAGEDDKGPAWYMTTVSSKERPFIRTSIRGLPAEIDVTIRDWEHPERYGLGKLLTEAGWFSASKVVPIKSAQRGRRK